MSYHHRPKTYYRHMTPEKAAKIRELYFSRQHKQADLAEMFELKQNSISRIISDLVWAHE